MYGLQPGEPYTTDIRVQPGRAGIRGAIRALFAGPTVRLRFDDTAAPAVDGTVGVLRAVAADLDHREWVLHVTVTDARGRSASRERTFHIRATR